MTITNYFLSAPSVAPTVTTTTPGSIQLAHRRVNPDGTYTAPSPIATNIVLPNTAIPQSYANSDVFRDEFLVSNDGGNTWRIVPRIAPLTGAQSIPAFDTNWAIASLTDTQESAATAVDFGTFLAGDSATKTIWIVNRTLDIANLRFSVLNDLNQLITNLDGILEISLVGIANDSGTGTLNTSFNETKIYNTSVAGSGFFTLTANNPSAIKIELQLVNYPLSGLSENIDYQLSIVPNAVFSSSSEGVPTDQLPLGKPEGLTLNWVSTTSISVSPGRALVPTNTNRRLVGINTSTFTKTLTDTFATGSGNGGRAPSVSLTANSTYHVFLAVNSSGVVDFFFDTSVSGDNFPAGFSSRRRIGSILTDGNSNIRNFLQVQDTFYHWEPINDFSGTVPTSTSNLQALTVPQGIRVFPLLRLISNQHSQSVRLYSADLPVSANSTAVNITGLTDTTVIQRLSLSDFLATNTSRQIRFYADGSVTATISTIGWRDPLV